MNTREEVQQAQDIVGPSQVCDRCGIDKPLSDFDRFETKWAPRNIHRWCRPCREEHNQRFDKALVVFLQDLFLETKRACEDRAHSNYANWGALGTVDRFYSVDQFIEHIVDDLGYDSVEKLEGLTLGLIHSVVDDFTLGNIRFAVGADNRDVMCEVHVDKFVSLKRSAPVRKENQDEEN